jgi:hypothetical protein
MPVEKIDDKRYGEITLYKFEFCRNDYSNQRELQEHMKLARTQNIQIKNQQLKLCIAVTSKSSLIIHTFIL